MDYSETFSNNSKIEYGDLPFEWVFEEYPDIRNIPEELKNKNPFKFDNNLLIQKQSNVQKNSELNQNRIRNIPKIMYKDNLVVNPKQLIRDSSPQWNKILQESKEREKEIVYSKSPADKHFCKKIEEQQNESTSIKKGSLDKKNQNLPKFDFP